MENNLRQSLELFARFPIIVAYAYQAKKHFYDKEIEIGKIGYSDDESLQILSEILFVRYGKKSIKVMTDETVYSQISEKLSEAIEK